MQVLQPINDQQQPVKITSDYLFQEAPITRCIYHPQYIRHFCKEPSCLMPLCQDCIQVHPHQHSRYIDSIESTLTQVYKGYASRANEIATHQTGDILQIRQDLHKLIDTIVDDVLNKADKNYHYDLIVQWRNLIKKLERLRDPNNCLKETILYFADQDNQNPLLKYQGVPIQVNYEALEQAKFHLHHLFMVTLQDGEYFFRPGERTGDNPIRRVSRMIYDPVLPTHADYQPYNYSPQRMMINQPMQPIPQPVIYQTQVLPPVQTQQPSIVQIVPQVQPYTQTPIQPQPIQYALPQPQPQPIVINKTEVPQPLVYYQESPIKMVSSKQDPIIQQSTVPQVVIQQQTPQPQIIQYVQPVVRAPQQVVPTVYTVSNSKPFAPLQSGEYSHPYPLVQQ
ncbi:unnamed protein product (macronuclear) [Paramecium tetraurelia]|uniref:B box-type domain-containing protein n=1 Tax=Paramecium tetraurelia TaxID=5888 RepID=A0E9X5_PARTE|nr:uncharacterized protein GSPATT00024823001 [Paramecium tetraurelia]CAK92092.1 unnamed protein product [Paramecium tetraurelia]|eukprot:XP_001459489.1 hypothetical protein (macronuclear) [Paramecium tetraurelia strain d4-2]